MAHERSGDSWYVEITEQTLDLSKYVQKVTSPTAGAISTFIGTTRNSFQGKAVIRLEYEAYIPMALAKLQELCLQIHKNWQVTHVAVAHRTGAVAVCEASVVIAVSSPHRRASLEASVATHWAIDELKASVPIWKKEFFEDGSIWKENPESRALLQVQPPAEPQAVEVQGSPAV
eukprot:gene5243-5478_t